uniref:Uncharacterized protein n=1 Tax=Graphocephala atropunctata TaxID=36148 RepID=A0A1B6MLH5_9HEMI
MYTQSCNYLPNKKQSSFTGSIPQQLERIKNLTSKQLFNFKDSSMNMSVDIQTIIGDQNQDNIVPSTNIIDSLVYSFRDTSKLRNTHSTTPNQSEIPKSNGKGVIAQYNRIAATPVFSSRFVGGFIGSKSQIGRKPANDLSFKWDKIQELVEIIGHPPNMPSNENNESGFNKETHCNSWGTSDQQHFPLNNFISNSCASINHPSDDLKKMEQEIKQSYADVAKAKSCKMPSKEIPLKPTKSFQPIDNKISNCQSKDCSWQSNVAPLQSLAEKHSDRNRFVSECSADSEDSFIVFEYCEDDHSVDEDSCCSDDEGIPDSHSNEESHSDFGSLPPRNFSFTKKCNPRTKKVRFAKGKELTQIHRMVTWDFAYRSARKGPWETLALDSQRFKSRVAGTEEILAPILDPQHRAAVYRLRFSPALNSAISS